MTGGGFQKGGPGRANSVEGGNIVPVAETGSKRTRPMLRGDLIEGLFDWCPDGTYGIYVGYPTDPTMTNSPIQIYRYDIDTNALTDLTPLLDCNGIDFATGGGAGIPTVQFLAVKFQPFYAPEIAGYICYIVARVTYFGGVTSTQIWLYNGGTLPYFFGPPGPGITTQFDLLPGIVNTYDNNPAHLCSFFLVPNINPGPWPGQITTQWVNDWQYLSALTNIGIFRDIGFSWGGDADPEAHDTVLDAPQQVPYGLVIGDGPAYWGDDTVIGTGAAVDYPVPLANVYCIPFYNAGARFLPSRVLEYVETNIPQGSVATAGVGALLANVLTPAVPPGWVVNALTGGNVVLDGISYVIASNTATTLTVVGGPLAGPYAWWLPPIVGTNFPEPVVPPTGATVDSHLTKLTMFRKGISVLSFNDVNVVNRVWEASGNASVTFYNCLTTPPSYGRIRRMTDGVGHTLPIAFATFGMTFSEIDEMTEYTSGVQELTFAAGGYVACTNFDLGKPVKDETGAHFGTLLAFDNPSRTWDIQTVATFAIADVCAVSAIGSTGRGTVNAVSWTPTLAGVNADDPTQQPMYTDVTWGPDRNALITVGRDGHIKTVTNRKWIFANPVDLTYHIDDVQFPDSTTIHTGIQWSPDGVGYLLTSKTFNSDPDNTGGAVGFESVSDAFVRNLVTYYSPSTGYQIFTLNESRVTGFPFPALNPFGQEHYRYAWHPFSRYCLFSLYGGFEKFDQDLFVDAGTITVNATVTALNVRIEDGNSGLLADVVADPATGLNRLCVEADINTANLPSGPLFTQDEGQMCFEEFSPGDSTLSPVGPPAGWSTMIPTAFITAITDWSMTTGVVSAGAVPSIATLMFRHPIMISRIALAGDLNEVSVDVIEVNGVDYNKIDTVTNADGADSGNFPPKAVMGIRITANNPSDGFGDWLHSTIYELAVWKVHETKVANGPADPIMAQLQQQVVMADIYSVAGGVEALNEFVAQDCTKLFDKDISTGVTYTISHADESINAVLNHPKLVSRVVLTGVFHIGDKIQVAISAANGTQPPQTVVVLNPLNNALESDTLILDSGNFQVLSALIISIRVEPGTSPTGFIGELAIFKDIEVKIADQDGYATSMILDLIGSALVTNGTPICGQFTDPEVPVPFLTPLSLGAEGVKIYTSKVNCELQLQTATPCTTIKGFVDWYWSDDDATYYYMASTDISDTAGDDGNGNPNPTGYNDDAVDNKSNQNIACPQNAIGKYLNIVVRNTDAAVDFVVLFAKITQR